MLRRWVTCSELALKGSERIARRTSLMIQSILDSPSDRRKHFSLMDDSCCDLLTRTRSDVPTGVVLKSLRLTLPALGFSQRPDNQMRQTASLPSSVLVFSPLFSVEGFFHKALHLNVAVWENGTVEIYKDWFVLSELIRFYVEASLSAALIF